MNAVLEMPRVVHAPAGRDVPTTNGCWAVLAAATLWGFIGPAMALLPRAVSPVSIAAARMGIGAFGFLAIMAWRPVGLQQVVRRDTWGWLLVAAAATAITQITFMLGLAWAGVAIGTALQIGLFPVFTAGAQQLVGSGRITARWAALAALAVGGCWAMVLDGGGSVGPRFGWGVAAAVASSAATAIATVASAHVITAGNGSTSVMATMIGGAAIGLSPALMMSSARSLITPCAGLVVLFLGLVATTGAYLLYGYGLRQVSTPVAATLSLAEPATATIAAVLLLGERLGLIGTCGLVAILAALVLTSLRPRADRPGPRHAQGRR